MIEAQKSHSIIKEAVKSSKHVVGINQVLTVQICQKYYSLVVAFTSCYLDVVIKPLGLVFKHIKNTIILDF